MNSPLPSAPSFQSAAARGPRAATACPCARPCDDVDVTSLLMRVGEPFRFKRGEQLWRQGEAADTLFAVCTGAVKLSREWTDGRELILDLVFRGRVAGEAAAVPGAAHATTATALAAGRGMKLSGERLQRLLQDDPKAARKLLELAVHRQMAFSRRLDEMHHGQVENRLAKVLLRIGEEVGLKDSRGTFVPVKLSRGDLADLVGCRVETTIRVMTRWQREGVVETQREGLVIRDEGNLKETAAAVA